MEIDDLLANPKEKADIGDLLDDDQIGILNILEESISFVLQQWQVDDTNDSVQISSVQLRGKDHIYLSFFPFCPKNFIYFGLN